MGSGDARRHVPALPPVGGNAAGAAYCHHYLVTENCCRRRKSLALTWTAGYTRPRMVTDAIHPSCRLALTHPTTRQPDNPTTRQPDNPTTRQPDNPTTRQPDNPTTRQPDNPTTRQPDNPTTRQPDNPTTRQPDNPTTRQPDNPTTRQPDNPTTRQPDNPTTRQPDNPTTARAASYPLRQPCSGRPLGPGAERTIDPRGAHPPRIRASNGRRSPPRTPPVHTSTRRDACPAVTHRWVPRPTATPRGVGRHAQVKGGKR